MIVGFVTKIKILLGFLKEEILKNFAVFPCSSCVADNLHNPSSYFAVSSEVLQADERIL